MHRPLYFSHRLGLGLFALLVVLGTLTTGLLLAQHSSFMQFFAPTVAVASSTSGSISAGNYHSLALKPDGTVWSWGSNGFGELGDGTSTDRHLPVHVLAVACSSCGTYLTGITAVSTGAGCICQ